MRRITILFILLLGGCRANVDVDNPTTTTANHTDTTVTTRIGVEVHD